MLTFIVPVRHQETARDWHGIKRRLSVTLRSIAGQDCPNWTAAVVANVGADLPEMPSQFKVVAVDLAPNIIESPSAGSTEEFFQAVRLDKGRRILAGLLAAKPTGHVMVVDFDDLVSRQVASLAANQPTANGWFFNTGYLFSGGATETFLYQSHFFEICGTSHVIKASLLNIPRRFEDATPEYITRSLGSHRFIKSDLASHSPLVRAPFPGAMYRIGHTDATSGSQGLRQFIKRASGGSPDREVELLQRLRPIDDEIVNEFFSGLHSDACVA